MGSSFKLRNAQDQEFSINHNDNAGAIIVDSDKIVVKDASGNVGIGVTPSASSATKKTIELSTYGLITSRSDVASYINIGGNTTADWIYKTTNAASQYEQSGGVHRWHTASSGTVGSVITWSVPMTLDNTGLLTINQEGTAGNRGLKITSSTVSTSSRQWKVLTDYHLYGDFCIRQSTTQTGETYSTKFMLSPSGNLLVNTAADNGVHKVQTSGKYASITGNNYYPTVNFGSDNSNYTVDIQGVPSGVASFCPIVGGGNLISTVGYTAHSVIGSWRNGNGGWAGGHIGTFITPGGGNDNYSTTYYLLKDNGQIGWSGGTPTLVSLSDIRKKDKKEDLINGLEKINTLTPFIGRYKEDITDRDKVFLSAQEVQKILPEAVSENEEGFLQLSYIDLVPLLISAVKDLTKEIENLKLKIGE